MNSEEEQRLLAPVGEEEDDDSTTPKPDDVPGPPEAPPIFIFTSNCNFLFNFERSVYGWMDYTFMDVSSNNCN